MSLTVKAFLEQSGDTRAEIRRFQVPGDASSSYDYLFNKIAQIFPSLKRGNFSLFWKDPDGDLVSFSTDEELMEALGFVTDSTLKIYIKEKKRRSTESGESEQPELHPGVICDGCEGRVYGNRYKCMVCPDYDLCETCEKKGLHTEHNMRVITTPIKRPNWRGHGFPTMFGFPFPGPHGHPCGSFVPPPQFHQWMQQMMKRCHGEDDQGCCGRNQDAKKSKQEDAGKPENQDKPGETTEEEDYLKSVGESVAAMLDPFGIDVEVDVEHGGRRTRLHGRFPGKGRKCGQKGSGKCPWSQGRHTEDKPQSEERGEPQDKEESQPSTSTSEDQLAKQMEEVLHVDKEPETSENTEDQTGPKSSGESDDNWTMLTVTTEADKQTDKDQTDGEEMDPKYGEALHQMLCMGFNNDGGWLSRLLEAKNGDIVKVLDAIKPQPGNSGDGGNMA